MASARPVDIVESVEDLTAVVTGAAERSPAVTTHLLGGIRALLRGGLAPAAPATTPAPALTIMLRAGQSSGHSLLQRALQHLWGQVFSLDSSLRSPTLRPTTAFKHPKAPSLSSICRPSAYLFNCFSHTISRTFWL